MTEPFLLPRHSQACMVWTGFPVNVGADKLRTRNVFQDGSWIVSAASGMLLSKIMASRGRYFNRDSTTTTKRLCEIFELVVKSGCHGMDEFAQ